MGTRVDFLGPYILGRLTMTQVNNLRYRKDNLGGERLYYDVRRYINAYSR